MKDEDFDFAVRVARTPPRDRQSLITAADVKRKDYSALARDVLDIIQGKEHTGRAALVWAELVQREAAKLSSPRDVAVSDSQTSTHTQLAESFC